MPHPSGPSSEKIHSVVQRATLECGLFYDSVPASTQGRHAHGTHEEFKGELYMLVLDFDGDNMVHQTHNTRCAKIGTRVITTQYSLSELLLAMTEDLTTEATYLAASSRSRVPDEQR